MQISRMLMAAKGDDWHLVLEMNRQDAKIAKEKYHRIGTNDSINHFIFQALVINGRH